LPAREPVRRPRPRDGRGLRRQRVRSRPARDRRCAPGGLAMSALHRTRPSVLALGLAACVGGVPQPEDDSDPPGSPVEARIASGSASGPEIALGPEAPQAAWSLTFEAPAAVVDPGTTASHFVVDFWLQADPEVTVVAEVLDCDTEQSMRREE